MAEPINIQDMIDGRLDIKSLGEAANGDENTQVVTRLGETYPSAKKAINNGITKLFENGGLPAKGFETKAAMVTDGASLPDGSYAMVTDEEGVSADNNGLYIKELGAWVKSKYDNSQKVFIQRGNVTTGSALSSYTSPGTYSVAAGVAVTDAPIGMQSNKNYMLVNTYAWENGTIIVQTLEGASDVKEKWGRVIRKAGTIIADWKEFKVESSDLAPNFNFRKNLSATDDLDSINYSGLFLVIGKAINMPIDATTASHKLNVEAYGSFIKQTLTANEAVDKVWTRSFRSGTETNASWKYVGKSIATSLKLGEVIAGKGLEVNALGVLKTIFSGTDGLIGASDLAPNYSYRKSLTKVTDDLNELYTAGNYVIVGELVPNRPADAANVGFLNVEPMGSSAIQTWINDDLRNTTYVRKIQKSGGVTVAKAWYCLNTEHISHVASGTVRGTVKVGTNLSITADGTLSASGGGGSVAFTDKKILCFGDSITEFKNYPQLVGARLGATALNIGMGGCRMAKHHDLGYNEMCMYRLADDIGLNDFSALTAAAEDVFTRTGDNNKPQSALLASTDFTTVDYITILYGTNDFNESVPIGTNTDITADGSTFKGSLNYSIKRILETYPHVKILLITPPYRFRKGTSGTGADSDDSPNASGKFAIDYVDAIIELAKLNHLPVLDLYRESGINKYTAPLYLNPPPDGVHLTPTGAELLAAKIASKLASTY